MDSEGNPIPGASVSIYLDGKHFLTPALADIGGNVAMSADDLDRAANARPRTPEPQRDAKRDVYAVVSAPGYVDKKVEIRHAPNGSLVGLNQRYEVTLEKAGMSPLLPILGVMAGLGLVAWLANK